MGFMVCEFMQQRGCLPRCPRQQRYVHEVLESVRVAEVEGVLIARMRITKGDGYWPC